MTSEPGAAIVMVPVDQIARRMLPQGTEIVGVEVTWRGLERIVEFRVRGPDYPPTPGRFDPLRRIALDDLVRRPYE